MLNQQFIHSNLCWLQWLNVTCNEWHICNICYASLRQRFLVTKLATLHPNQLSTGSPTSWDLLTSRKVTKERNKYMHNYQCRKTAPLRGLGKFVLSRFCILVQMSLVFQNSGLTSYTQWSYIQIMINLLKSENKTYHFQYSNTFLGHSRYIFFNLWWL